MMVNKSENRKKEIELLQTARDLTAIVCDSTRLPYVECDMETCDDQVLVYENREMAEKEAKKIVDAGYSVRTAHIPQKQRFGFFANLYLAYTRFFVISLNFRLKYAILSLNGNAGFRDISCRRCTAADHAAGKLAEPERMTRYAARNTRRPVPARWRARLELGYGAQSHQPPIRHQLHDQRTAAVLSPPSAAKT